MRSHFTALTFTLTHECKPGRTKISPNLVPWVGQKAEVSDWRSESEPIMRLLKSGGSTGTTKLEKHNKMI